MFMLNKNIIVFFSLCAVISIYSFMNVSAVYAANDPAEFRYSVELKNDFIKDTIYQVPLNTEIIEKCMPECRDIRIIDPQTKSEVPYVIIDNQIPAESIQNYDMTIKEYFDETNAATLVLSLPDGHKPIECIELSTPNQDFKKNIILFGANDLRNWVKLSEDNIYDFSSQVDYRKTMINCPDGKLNFYKIQIIDTNPLSNTEQKSINLKYEGLDFSVNKLKNEKLKINSITGRTNFHQFKGKKVIYQNKTFSDFSASLAKNNDTVITLRAALPFEKISFNISNSYYYRKITVYFSETGVENSYQYLCQSILFNYPDELKNAKNQIYYSSPKHNYYKFVIENKNNPPLSINSINFEYVAQNLYFIALNDTSALGLYFGHDKIAAPDYDIKNFLNEGNWYKKPYKQVTAPSQAETNKNVKEVVSADKKGELEKTLLIVIITLLVAGLCFWLYKLLNYAPPAQQ